MRSNDGLRRREQNGEREREKERGRERVRTVRDFLPTIFYVNSFFAGEQEAALTRKSHYVGLS